MNNFNFNSLATTSFTNNAPQYLRPFDIYEVNLTKIEPSKLKGKDGTEYDVISLEFKGCGENKGIFSHNLFVPNKDEDFNRRTNESTGAQYPSAWEQFQATLAQLCEVINPEGFKKIQKLAADGALKGIEDFINLMVKGLSNKENVKVYLKLVGRNYQGTFYANLPNACIIGRDATDPSPLNFVSTDPNKLQFSNYEINQMKVYKSAKPTNMDKVDTNDEDKDDINLDDVEI